MTRFVIENGRYSVSEYARDFQRSCELAEQLKQNEKQQSLERARQI